MLKYKVSFTIKPDRKKITLGYRNFDKLIEEKIKWLGLCYGKVKDLRIEKLSKNLKGYHDVEEFYKD